MRHGRYFLYNNWDFNALGAILEQVTRRSLYDVFTADIATPIGLQDWNPASGAYRDLIRNDTGLSRHPAHHFVLSTRDMARLGYLMLRHGRWGERQVLSAAWVRRSSRTVTPAAEVARTSPFVDGSATACCGGPSTAPGSAGRRSAAPTPRPAPSASSSRSSRGRIWWWRTRRPCLRRANVGADAYIDRILPAVLALVR